jgi:hypothetical protein
MSGDPRAAPSGAAASLRTSERGAGGASSTERRTSERAGVGGGAPLAAVAAAAAAVDTPTGDAFVESLRRLGPQSPMATRMGEVQRVRGSLRRYALTYEAMARIWAEAEGMLDDAGGGAGAAVDLAGSFARHCFEALGPLRLELLSDVVAARNAGERERHRALCALTADGTAAEPFAEKVHARTRARGVVCASGASACGPRVRMCVSVRGVAGE